MTSGYTLTDIPTPAVVVDLPAMQRNINRMAKFFEETTCKLRPHFKAHKTPEIGRQQLEAGSCTGLTCSTISEAEIAADFCDDILIANEIIGRGKCDRVAALAHNINVKVAVDGIAGLEQITVAAKRAGVVIGVVVEVNVGMPRCGVAPGEPALALAREVVNADNVVLRGLMGYEGHAVGLVDRSEREKCARQAMAQLLFTVRMLRTAGIRCDIVSAGGTGTYSISGLMDGVTEIQAGSYVLMDTAYAKLDIPFEQAFSVLGTIISRPESGFCVADCGHKSMTQDHGYPTVKEVEGASIVLLSDEHATVALPPDSLVSVGNRIQFWPSHIDPTINLHDVFYALDGDIVMGVWPIAARGYSDRRRQGD